MSQINVNTIAPQSGSSVTVSGDISATNQTGSIGRIEGATINLTGDLTAKRYVVSSSVTELSVITNSGSTAFGDSLDDTHIYTGSLQLTGSVSASKFIGDGTGLSNVFEGTAPSASISTRLTSFTDGSVTLVSGSATSTGSFGAVGIGTNDFTAASRSNVLRVAGNAYFDNSIRLGDQTEVGTNGQFKNNNGGVSLYTSFLGANIIEYSPGTKIRGHSSRGESYSGVQFVQGDVLFTVDNQLISGSASSTGSFGKLEIGKIESHTGNDLKILNKDSRGIILHDSDNQVSIGIHDETSKARLNVNQETIPTTNQFTDPHIRLSNSAATNNGLAGIAFSTSTAENYGITLGGLRVSGGDPYFVINTHAGSASGTERLRMDPNGNFSVGGNISGSVTSTGSFGSVVVDNNLNVGTKIEGVGDTLEIKNAGFTFTGNGGQAQFGSATAGWFHSSGRTYVRKDAGFTDYAFKAVDYPAAAGFWVDTVGRMIFGTGMDFNIYDMMTLGHQPGHASGSLLVSGSIIAKEGNISGSAASTGSFGAARIVDKLGIGVSNPDAKIDIQDTYGTIHIGTQANNNPEIRLTGTGVYGANIILDGANSGHGAVSVKIENFFLGQQYGAGGDFHIDTTLGGSMFCLTSGGNLGIGTNSPTDKLHVVGDIRATGDIIAENFIVSSSVTEITYQSLSGSTIFGDDIGDTHQFTGSLQISGGLQLTSYNQGYGNINNTHFGVDAGAGGTNQKNVAIGYQAMSQESDSGKNVAIGYQSMYEVASADQNTAIGMEAGAQTNQDNTVYIGYQTGKTANTFNSVLVGNGAGYRLTGGYNVVVGADGAYEAVAAAYNVFIGTNSARGITTGDGNVFIGYNASGSSVNSQNRIAIGSGSYATSDNQTVIGNSGQTEVKFGGNVTIGDASGNISGSATSTGSFGSLNIGTLRLAYSSVETGYQFSAPFLTAQGSYSAPGIGIGDVDTGFYDSGANLFGVTAGGTPIIEYSANAQTMAAGKHIILQGTGNVSGSITSTGSFGHVLVGGTNIETFISSSAAADGFGSGGSSGGSGDGFPFDGQAQITGSLIISGAIHPMTASLHITDDSFTDTHVLSQSLVVAVDGNNGRLFSVTDQMSGSLFSANTVAGLPVIEAFSDNKVTLGPFSNQVIVDGDGHLSGSATSTGSFGRVIANSMLVDSGSLLVSGSTPNVYEDGLVKIKQHGQGPGLFVEGGRDANLRLRSTSYRGGIFIDEPGTSTTMGSMLVLPDDNTFRLGTNAHYHMTMYSDTGLTTILSDGVDTIILDTDQNAEFAGNISGSLSSTGSFGKVKGDIVGQRPMITHIADFSASMAYAGHYNIVHGGLTCSILPNATAEVDTGTEYEFFQTSSLGNMLFETGSGVSLYVKNDNLNIAGQYSGASLKKVATNTWHLVGDLT